MEWISVEKVKPEYFKDVLIWIQNPDNGECRVAYLKRYSDEDGLEKDCYRGWYLNEHDWDDDRGKNVIKDNVTHWRPLPDGP